MERTIDPIPTPLNVAVIGVGYVGLSTAITLAYLGHRVTGVEVDGGKLERLQRGELPFYEPYLAELLERASSNLRFTGAYAQAVPQADVVLIAVGTPPNGDGTPDLSYLRAAARSIGQNLGEDFTVVINKSTVPIGSGYWVEALVEEGASSRPRRPDFAVASNPEFLREGSALFDSLYPDRVVVGAEDPRALRVLRTLYQPLVEQDFPAPDFLPRPPGLREVPFLATDLASAELIKYAANAFLALKISFINEVGALAEKVGADVTRVAQGIGLDSRIGPRFLQAGVGWGGSCFGKDTAALVATARDYGLSMPIVEAARQVNYRQRERVVEKLLEELKVLKGRTVGLLGLAFKPDTDDLRDAPALDIARRLLERGARVRVHDPVAMERARREHPELDVAYCTNPEHLAAGADALVLVTEWPEYQALPWGSLRRLMRRPLLLDTRNCLDLEHLSSLGFRCMGMGTLPVHPAAAQPQEEPA